MKQYILQQRRGVSRDQPEATRNATAAVELALVAPLLVLLVMGSIEFGQLVNTSQAISNGARVGAKKATRADINYVTDVEYSVKNYLENLFSGAGSTAQVKVFDNSGIQLSGTELGGIDSGDEISVEVTVNFDTVRWMSGFAVPDGQILNSKTYMRRE